MGGLSGFGAMFIPKDTAIRFVGNTDGVSLAEIAIDLNQHEQIGIDLVAMCVNDLIVCGAEPGVFGLLRNGPTQCRSYQPGDLRHCRRLPSAGCTFAGGETAEMPDVS